MIALAVVATLIAARPLAAADPVPTPATLSISATGRVTAHPDIAVVGAGIIAEGKTSAEALAQADKAASALVAEVAAAGIPKADIATEQFSVTPVWGQREQGGRKVDAISGYQVTNRFTIRVRRLADLGPLLERLVGKGTNSVSGIAFEVSDIDAKREEARIAAVKTAMRRAETLTSAAGQRIARVLTITEGGGEMPSPVFAKRAMAADAGAVPVEAGTETITAEVSMTFEIVPADKN